MFFSLFFSLVNLSIGESGVMTSPIVTMLVVFCGFASNRNCLMKLDAHVFIHCTFTIIMSYDWAVP